MKGCSCNSDGPKVMRLALAPHTGFGPIVDWLFGLAIAFLLGMSLYNGVKTILKKV